MFVYTDGHSAVTTVQLIVLPANIDRPIFTSATYVTYLHVNMSVGEFVVAVATVTGARGRHGNGPTFHITAGNVGSVFAIEPRSGLTIYFLPLFLLLFLFYNAFNCTVLSVQRFDANAILHGLHSPGAAAPASVLLELSSASVDTILDRAADRTCRCRLVVFKEVHLVSTPSLQTPFECIH